MPMLILRDATVLINGISFSNLARHVEVGFEYRLVETTMYGTTVRMYRAGLPEAAVVGLEFYVSTTGAGPLDGPIIGPTRRLPFTVGALQEYVTVAIGASTATGTYASGPCAVVRYSPLSGDIGHGALMRLDLRSIASLTITNTGGGALYPATDLFPSGFLVP